LSDETEVDHERIVRPQVESAAACGDPFAKVRLSDFPACDGSDDGVGFIGIPFCWHPRPTIPLQELDRGEEGAAFVPVWQRMVLHEVPAEHGCLRLELGICLNTAKPACGAAKADAAKPIRSKFAISSAGTPRMFSAIRR
jgi:hypothetical protein